MYQLFCLRWSVLDSVRASQLFTSDVVLDICEICRASRSSPFCVVSACAYENSCVSSGNILFEWNDIPEEALTIIGRLNVDGLNDLHGTDANADIFLSEVLGCFFGIGSSWSFSLELQIGL